MADPHFEQEIEFNERPLARGRWRLAYALVLLWLALLIGLMSWFTWVYRP